MLRYQLQVKLLTNSRVFWGRISRVQRMPENNPSSSGDEVRQVLERVLTTANLYSSKRNQELLRYLIDGAASGRSASFKEF